MIIGFRGYATAGKDTAAMALIERGWKKRSFADKLREFVLAINPIVGSDLSGAIRYKDALDILGYDDAKQVYPEVRRILQAVGTEGARTVFWDSFWVDLAIRDLDKNNDYVFTDVRFPNEAQAIVDIGGYIVEIIRPGVGPQSDHPSEISLDGWNFYATIVNDGTVNDLYAKVNDLTTELYIKEMA